MVEKKYQVQHNKDIKKSRLGEFKIIILKDFREFPGNPVVRTLHSHCRGSGFAPWLGKSDPRCHKDLSSRIMSLSHILD